MRWLQAILLLLFLGVLVIFAVQNQDTMTLRFLEWNMHELPKALVLIAAYLLGMLSGWTVVGFIRRSLRGVESLAKEQRGARADV